mmetsp:Transcript_16279/g.41914  ORF Transcript_16279/g.41914 Transcript_16279/m.41914 type:complete len:201 (-) Transcript_16279:207-809(-)
MPVGSAVEANDYAEDAGDLWIKVEGALAFLENNYCEITGAVPLTENKQAMFLYVESTQLINKVRNHYRPAIEKFEEVLQLLDQSGDATSLFRGLTLQRKAWCRSAIGDYETVLRHYNSALGLIPPSHIDNIKELFYNRAYCEDAKGDLHGALEDYTSVFERIGHFTSAKEGIDRLQAKLNIQRQPIPRHEDRGLAETLKL